MRDDTAARSRNGASAKLILAAETTLVHMHTKDRTGGNVLTYVTYVYASP